MAGVSQTSSPKLCSTGLTLFAGLFQADFERINSKRYRMEWEEKSAENCIWTLDESNLPVTASTPRGKPYSAEIPRP